MPASPQRMGLVRTLAIIANAGTALVLLVWLVNGDIDDFEEVSVFLLIAVVPTLSLLALLGPPPGEPGWIQLFLQRKRLEERRRIARLEAHQPEQQLPQLGEEDLD